MSPEHFEIDEDRARVAVRPPLLLLGCLVTGLLLHGAFPVGFVPGPITGTLGFSLVMGAIALFLWAAREMTAAGEELPTSVPSSAIVQTGPYAVTRNPIYLAFCVLQLGIAVWLNGIALLASLAFCLWVLNEGVIAKEEQYLESKFGQPYRDYLKEVRRWL